MPHTGQARLVEKTLMLPMCAVGVSMSIAPFRPSSGASRCMTPLAEIERTRQQVAQLGLAVGAHDEIAHRQLPACVP